MQKQGWEPIRDPLFDADDELVFMYRDSGLRATGSTLPAHVEAQSGFEVAIKDGLDPDATRYVYLFQHDGTLDPGASARYVGYNYRPLPLEAQSRDLAGFRNEDSTFASAHYTQHMAAPWTVDGLTLATSGSESPDLLDRLRVQFQPGDCERSEDSMSWSQPDYLINRSGPVRALRGYIGANSGAFTQRVHILYAQRQDIVTDLRVHNIPGIMLFADYAPSSAGMTYVNNLLQSSVPIDGIMDDVPTGALQWEMITGAPGSIVSTYALTTTIPGLVVSSFYEDAVVPTIPTCTGDDSYYGASGFVVLGPIPCTDPARAAISTRSCPIPHGFRMTQTLFYLEPGVTVPGAQALDQQSRQPLTVLTQRLNP